MFRNYLKILLRNAWHHKGFTIINLAGLVVGITVCLQVFLFVDYEKTFDTFHLKKVYRLVEQKRDQGEVTSRKVAQTFFPIGPALKAEFPQVKNFARIISGSQIPLLVPGKQAVMGIVYGADASFLQVFNFPLIDGDINTALIQPRSIVLTQRLSYSLFGTDKPIGKTIRHEGRDTTEYHVTAVVQDPPRQSHLQFDALYSISTHAGLDTVNNWEMDWIFTYIQLEESADPKKLEAHFPGFLSKRLPHKPDTDFSILLQPVDGIHLESNDITRDLLNTKKFNGHYLVPLMAIALFVLFLAIINYINLSSASAFTRVKEVAIRKTNGANRTQITLQFVGETFIFSLAAFLISIAMSMLLEPLFETISNRSFDFNLLHRPMLLLFFLALTLLVGLVAGIFPAISLSSLKPMQALKGKLFVSHRSTLQNMLVVVQFTISVAMSMITLNVFRQLDFIKKYDVGFNKDAVVVVPVAYVDKQKEETMMQELKQLPGIVDLTASLRRLGNNNIDRNRIVVEDNGGIREIPCSNLFVDFNYCKFYKIRFLAGRDLSPVFGNDRNRRSFVINESLARLLLNSSDNPPDFSKLIGTNMRYNFDDSAGTVVGVVRDFNFNSLHQRIEPLCITYQNEYYFSDLSVRIDLAKSEEAIANIQKAWIEFLPKQQFSYYFLDKHLENLYQSDIQTSNYMAVFTGLAFVIACLGIIGMAAFNIERRVKEIGVRKVLGASVGSIILLLSRDFLKLVLISIVIALPISLAAINRWMENFAYRAGIDWWFLAISGFAAIFIAQLTISFQALRAAIANPVKSLYNE